jgi:hypothetical protein
MTAHAFMSDVCDGVHDRAVRYVSAQDDSFTREFAALLGADVLECRTRGPLFMADALGAATYSAMNLWWGDSRSVTTMHSDPFENVYVVVRGAKTFTLLPPSDEYALRKRAYPSATYDASGVARLDDPACEVEWCTVDPADSGCTPLVVTVRAGEALYLPALWLHKVEQEDCTIAVNWWYDSAAFEGPLFALKQFVETAALVTRHK